MKILNKTHWQTKPLARIARRVLTLECAGRPERAQKQRALRLTIGYNRGNGRYFKSPHSSGHAWLGGRDLTVNVPSHRVDPVDFAFVVGHELGHVWGLTHDQMKAFHYERGAPASARYAWAKTIAIGPRATKQAAATVDMKLQHARRMLKAAETRAKRAATIVTKWRQKTRYYERRSAVPQAAMRRESGHGEQAHATTHQSDTTGVHSL